MYRVSRALYPLIKLFGENYSIKSTELAEVMFLVGMNGQTRRCWRIGIFWGWLRGLALLSEN